MKKMITIYAHLAEYESIVATIASELDLGDDTLEDWDVLEERIAKKYGKEVTDSIYALKHLEVPLHVDVVANEGILIITPYRTQTIKGGVI